MVEIPEHRRAGLADSRGVVEEYYSVFQGLEDLAKRYLLEGEYEKSAVYIQVAAHYAWFNPTGLLASFELESMLGQIGGVLKPQRHSSARTVELPPKNVLHVISEVYDLGGHSRLVWRWIRADAGRTYSIILTGQGARKVPLPLKDAIEASGGQIYYLDRRPGGLLARAQALRKLAADADHVILHTYPWDVVPLIAFGGRGGHPLVTLMNKDDHVFWLGASVADQVAQMRGSGSRLSQQRRGIPESRCSLLPIPIEVKARRNSRAEAKRQLGLSEDRVVLLSVATAYKYTASGGDHFAEVLLPIVREHRNVELIVIGPTEQGAWASASRQAAGRMKVLGKRKDIELFYEAADIYLDSFPISSLTSFLEAGSYGTPIVSYAANSPDAAVISGDDPALEGLLVRATTVDEYRSQISRLVRDEEFRTKLGEATRESILACHAQGGWNRYLEELYLQPGKGSGKEPLDESRALRNVTELDLRLAQIYGLCGLSSDLPKLIRFHMGFFPFKDRVRFWWGDFGHEWRSLPRFLLADWQKTRLYLLRPRLSKRNA